MLRTLVECALLIVATLVIGAIWNQVSGKGLTLSRDYFPRVEVVPPEKVDKPKVDKPEPPVRGPDDPTLPGPGGEEETEACPELLGGIQVVCLDDVMLYAEPGMADLVAFLDARTKDNYDESHIPGAYHLYTYQAEKMIDAIRPDLELKEFLIVYCGGGDCEDSVSLASMMINEFGYRYETVYVYKGGLDEWVEAGQPVTVGSAR